jgi:hypothetical protein
MSYPVQTALEDGANIAQIVSILYPLGGALVGASVVGVFAFRKNRRIAKNLARPLAIISVNDEMASECRAIEKAGYFNKLEKIPLEHRSADEIDKTYALAVLRYHDSEAFWHVYEKLSAMGVWTIVYSAPLEIPTADMARLQKYSYHALCNTPVRLLSDIWAIMAVNPGVRA